MHILKLVTRDEAAVLTLRWEATRPGGRLYRPWTPGIALTPAGEHATRLSLAGACGPPFAALGAGPGKAILHRAATATTRSFLNRAADALAAPWAAAKWRARSQALQPARHLAPATP
jgi:hypothetical protein